MESWPINRAGTNQPVVVGPWNIDAGEVVDSGAHGLCHRRTMPRSRSDRTERDRGNVTEVQASVMLTLSN